MPDSVRTDDELVERFKKGAVEAFEELVLRYQDQMVNFFYHNTYNKTLAEDYAQDVFVKLFVALGMYRAQSKFKYFLFRVARNYLIDKKRENKTKQVSLNQPLEDGEGEIADVIVAEPDPASDPALGEVKERIASAVMRLPEEHRTVIILSEYCNMDYSEISEILGIPVGTVKSRMHNAITKLKTLVGNLSV